MEENTTMETMGNLPNETQDMSEELLAKTLMAAEAAAEAEGGEDSTLEPKKNDATENTLNMLNNIYTNGENTWEERGKLLHDEEQKANKSENVPPEETNTVEEEDVELKNTTSKEYLSEKLSELSSIESATKKEKRELYKDNYIIPIDKELVVDTEEKRRHRDFLTLSESFKSRKPISGVIASITELNNMPTAVINYGTYKVYIPADEILTMDDRNEASNASIEDKRKTQKILLTRRLGSEIDFIVKAIKEKGLFAVASRKEAMNIKRRIYYNYKIGEKYFLNEGDLVEARVTAVHYAGITVEIFGMETRINQKQLSYNRMSNVAGIYHPGDRVLVKLTKLERNVSTVNGKRRTQLTIAASVKETQPDPRPLEYEKYSRGDIVIGYVTGVAEYGVYVRLGGKDGKIDALCNFPDRIECPQEGDLVQVKINAMVDEDYRIYGLINYSYSRSSGRPRF